MKAYVIQKGSSGFDGLRKVEKPKPTPGAGQVLVRVRAASLNFRDIAVVRGKYMGGPVQRDLVPLSDGAGEVEAVGDAVADFKPGDRVVATFTQGSPPAALGSPLDGTLTEYAVFPADGLVRIPAHLSFEQAATLPCAGVTAWNALMHGRVLRPGETVLTLGTGGVSILALQLAKIAGARVIVTSSSDEKLERAKTLGADATVNYKTHPDWERVVLELTGGQGADKVIELGAPATLPHSYQAVGRGGEIELIGVITRAEGVDMNPQPLMFKGATLRGIFVGPKFLFEELNRAIEVNRLTPVVDRVFGFDEAPDAFAYMKEA
ncbi:MAG TPA: NAD(P)-dependent alcohol dehydrogenase, partial [Gammaproteobacteria bacterium]|nr:NAD(P)-dependent alcohol dehydrogenase [Gammaproteobacteria bacterium]